MSQKFVNTFSRVQKQSIWKIIITNHQILWISALAKRPRMGSWPRFEQKCFIELINNEKIRFLRDFFEQILFFPNTDYKKKVCFFWKNCGKFLHHKYIAFHHSIFFWNPSNLMISQRGNPMIFRQNQCFSLWASFLFQSKQTGHLQAHSLFVGSNEGGSFFPFNRYTSWSFAGIWCANRVKVRSVIFKLASRTLRITCLMCVGFGSL